MAKAIASMLLVLLVAAREASAQFCPGLPPWVFDDVPSTHPFCTDITWMAQRGVTTGCRVIDPNHRLYCPNDNVTRGEMAAFMYRLGDALFPLTCAAGQVMKWNGLAWACANDNIGGGGGGGTVTSVAAGTGLTATPNPIVGAGVLDVAPAYRLPQGCAANQIPKWNGAAWTCAADAAGTGTVTSLSAGAGITLAPNPIVAAGTVAADTAYLQRRVSTSCAPGSSIRAIAADGSVTCETDDAGPANAFVQNGNAFGTSATLGTIDDFPVRIVANGLRVMRYEPNAISPNVIGGNPFNSVTVGVRGATIGGGGVQAGDPDFSSEQPNRVTDAYGTVGGGYGNRAGNDAGTTVDASFAVVAGGRDNIASADSSTVAGGLQNEASGLSSTIGGGSTNDASGDFSIVAGGRINVASGFASTMAGGFQNTATGDYSTVGGGQTNDAPGVLSTVAGGRNNDATGRYSTVAGGYDNTAGGDYSFAAGRRAMALGDGSFSFADSNDFDFSSNTANAFRVRATGGVRFVVEINPADGATIQSCLLTALTGGWSCNSDRNAKQDLVALDGSTVLEKLAAMPIYAWSPIGRGAQVRHYGPMAQDFRAAFGLGDDDTLIGSQDADGVALAAIQGLNAKFESQLAARDAIIDAQAREIAELRRAVDMLLTRTARDGRVAENR